MWSRLLNVRFLIGIVFIGIALFSYEPMDIRYWGYTLAGVMTILTACVEEKIEELKEILNK